MPKIISEQCELVKLCHINCSGKVFFRHTVVIIVGRQILFFTAALTTFRESFLQKMFHITVQAFTTIYCEKANIKNFIGTITQVHGVLCTVNASFIQYDGQNSMYRSTNNGLQSMSRVCVSLIQLCAC